MKTIITLIPIVFCLTVNAQDPTFEWQNTIGGNNDDNLNSIQQTADGGYIVGSTSNSSISGDVTVQGHGNTDYWILKLDASGNILWQDRIGGQSYDYLSSIQPTADGGYVMGGSSRSPISADKTEANWDTTISTVDYWIVKIDAAGTIQWDNTIGGTDADWLTSIQQTADGGYILGGYSESPLSGDKTEDTLGGIYTGDYWIVKLDVSGNIQWQNTIGGSDDDQLSSIEQTADGGYIVGGWSESNISGDKTENTIGTYLRDIWIVKLDASGNIQWQNTIGGNLRDNISSIQQTADGGYIIGSSSSSGIYGDKTEAQLGVFDSYWIIKLDAAGNILWQNTIGGNHAEFLQSIAQTPEGGYIMIGKSFSQISFDKLENEMGYGDFWVVTLDASGNIIWQNDIGGSDDEDLGNIIPTADGGFILGGTSKSDISGDKTENSLGDRDLWIVKLSRCANYTPSAYTVTCNSLCNGSVSLPVHAANSYSWSTGDTSLMIQNLCAGIYQYTVTDTVGACAGFAEVLEPDSLLVAPTLYGSCSFPRDYDLNISGGTPSLYGNYSYSFSSGGSNYGGRWRIPTAGTFSITVTDWRGCTATDSITASFFSASISSTPASCGQADGTASITISQGSGNYSIQWSPIISSDTLVTGLPAGNYTAIISDIDNGCTDSLSVTVAGTCGTISGHIFDDLNGNGIQDGGENGVAGITVEANPGGLSVVTDQNGDYSIGVGAYDTFSVHVNPPSRYYCSGIVLLPDSVSFPAGNYYSVIITPGLPDATGIDFGLAHPQSICGTISGYVFNDVNGNGMDDGEPRINGVVVQLSNGQSAVTDFYGMYSIQVGMPVSVTVSISATAGSCGTGQPSRTQTFPPFGGTYSVTVAPGSPTSTGNDFGVQQSTALFDVGVFNISAQAGSQAGQNFNVWMDYKSWGVSTQTCHIRLTHDPLVHFVSASFPPTTVTSTYVEWEYAFGTAPNWNCMTMIFYLDSSATAGTGLTWTGTYQCGSTDACPGNDTLVRTVIVTSGPLRRMQSNGLNSMEVFHTGNIYNEITRTDSVFSYVINFQNTSTDTTYHLTIVDTLSPHLNIETISYPFSNLPFKMHMPGNNLVVWEFDNSLIPDSTTDYLNSYGFIQYNIHMKANLAQGTVIENRATIISNYINAYQTNTTSVMISEPLSFSTSVTDVTCFGGNDGAINLAVNGGAIPYHFTWSTGATTEDLLNIRAGNYSVTIEDADSVIITDNITIADGFDVNAGSITGSDSVNIGQNASFNVAQVSGYIYSWSVSNGSIISGQGTNNIEVDFDIPGQGTITVMVSAQGCSETVLKNVVLSDPTGVRNALLNHIALHPNPTSGTVTLTVANGKGDAMVTIYDALGQKLLEQTFGASDLHQGVIIDLKEFNSHVFFLNISSEGGSGVMKVLKY